MVYITTELILQCIIGSYAIFAIVYSVIGIRKNYIERAKSTATKIVGDNIRPYTNIHSLSYTRARVGSKEG